MSDELVVTINRPNLLVTVGAIPVSVGGTDPWTVAVLESDFTDSLGTLIDTGLFFTPLANTRYLIEAHLLHNSQATTTGLVWCFTAPTSGVTRSAQNIMVANTINAQSLRFAQMGVGVSGTSVASADSYSLGRGFLDMGASPVGNLKVQAATEVPTSIVTIYAGSFLMYRTIP